MAERAKKISSTSQSPVGWYIASYIERFEFYDEDLSNMNRRCRAWENTVLIQANTPAHAYKKAMALGELEENEMQNDEGRLGSWKFEGLTSLLPIYEEFADGAEIMWEKHEGRSVKTIKGMVREKEDLEVFQPE